jgi:hypothetical protein
MVPTAAMREAAVETPEPAAETSEPPAVMPAREAEVVESMVPVHEYG